MWMLRPARLAPLLTIGILLAAPLLFPNRIVAEPGSAARRAAVAEAVRDAPVRIGPWVGTDLEFAPAAMRLLHPNAILSRRFERLGNGARDVHVLVVHCTDLRDMRGHWPPVCYPYTGWSYRDPEGGRRGRDVPIEILGRTLPARVYEFRRIEAPSTERTIRVLDLFVLPDGVVTPEIERINKLSERQALAARGLAQIQVVTDLLTSEDEAVSAAREILEGMPGLLAALGLGPEPHDAP